VLKEKQQPMSNRRFYEDHPTVKTAVESLFLFPDDIQRIIARGFSIIAERDCNALELLKEFRTLGSERVLALYKSKKKQRKYDQNPIVHEAMNYMLVMNEKSRVFLASKVIELVGFMQTYLKLCKQYATAPETEAIEAISHTYVEHGPEKAKAFLSQLDSEFKKRLLGASSSSETSSKNPSVKSVIEGIQTGNAGMRVKGGII
jgi:hypothetical protein